MAHTHTYQTRGRTWRRGAGKCAQADQQCAGASAACAASGCRHKRSPSSCRSPRNTACQNRSLNNREAPACTERSYSRKCPGTATRSKSRRSDGPRSCHGPSLPIHTHTHTQHRAQKQRQRQQPRPSKQRTRRVAQPVWQAVQLALVPKDKVRHLPTALHRLRGAQDHRSFVGRPRTNSTVLLAPHTFCCTRAHARMSDTHTQDETNQTLATRTKDNAVQAEGTLALDHHAHILLLRAILLLLFLGLDQRGCCCCCCCVSRTIMLLQVLLQRAFL